MTALVVDFCIGSQLQDAERYVSGATRDEYLYGTGLVLEDGFWRLRFTHQGGDLLQYGLVQHLICFAGYDSLHERASRDVTSAQVVRLVDAA